MLGWAFLVSPSVVAPSLEASFLEVVEALKVALFELLHEFRVEGTWSRSLRRSGSGLCSGRWSGF